MYLLSGRTNHFVGFGVLEAHQVDVEQPPLHVVQDEAALRGPAQRERVVDQATGTGRAHRSSGDTGRRARGGGAHSRRAGSGSRAITEQ